MTTLAVTAFQFAGNAAVQFGTQLATTAASNAITSLFDNRNFEGPRLESFHLQTSRDGAPMPRIYGRNRLAGQVIWATNLRETSEESRVSGGKGGGPTQTEFSYTISFAIGLCEGEILGVDRLWANGAPLKTAGLTIRVYTGDEDQAPDPIISATDGPNVPAFRGTAYIVFEDFPLDGYGGRLPQINAEVIRVPKAVNDGPRLETMIRSVNLLPGSGEYAYATTIAEETPRPGVSRPINMNNLSGQADIDLALDQLQSQLPNCRNVSIITAWFGTDLRCGECAIRPGVERRERVVPNYAWSVGSDNRGNAYLISQDEEGRPNYGGTPSDRSIKEAIAALKSRGFSVTLYPFLLMDIPTPPAFPWRGRITATVDKSVQTRSEVDTFFDSEFGYKNFITHYANLAIEAGGVDRLIIGSELRGLTTLRDQNNSFPAVTKLAELAAIIKSIAGPNTGLTYAADWTEYFGYHPHDSSGDVYFHLDELWSHPAISAVGIDAYFPLSDWRDTEDHLDKSAGQDGYDIDYMKSQIEGGEGYDYFYASDADRVLQNRSVITDGSAQKPWTFRYKDFRNWWANLHHNRVNGVEAAQPTSWQAQSKPIWLLEIGCPAIHNGAHQPNVFFDPKSSESKNPYFSEGYRDDLIQHNYLNALISYWENPANNPQSTAYSGPMIDTDLMSVWAWDARPFPDFPARSDVWADGDNWQYGHWITGRMGLVSLATILSEISGQAGLSGVDVSAVNGLVSGYNIDRPMSARAALTPLLDTYDVSLHEDGKQVQFLSLGLAKLHQLNPVDFVNSDTSQVTYLRDDPNTRLKDVRLHYIDTSNDYQLGSAAARDLTAETVHVQDISAPIVMDPAFAESRVRQRLKDVHLAMNQIAFELPEKASLSVHIGDRIQLNNQAEIFLIEQIDAGQVLRVGGRQIEAYQPLPVSGPAPSVTRDVLWSSRPAGFGFDLPGFNGPLLGSVMVPFESHQLSAANQTVEARSGLWLGALVTDLPIGSIGRWDEASSFSIFMPDAVLASRPDVDILAGQNSFTVETATGWEILQAAELTLIAPSTYRAKRLLRGQFGSDADMMPIIQSGARIIYLDRGVTPMDIADDWIGETLTVMPQSSGREGDRSDFLYTARHLRPLAPVHLRAKPSGSDWQISWVRRTRVGGDSWAGADVPLGEAAELYRVQTVVNDVVTESVETPTPFALISAPSGAIIRIAQHSDRYGWGAAAEIALP